MRDWEAQLRHGEKAYNYQNLTKNLPLKGSGGWGELACSLQGAAVMPPRLSGGIGVAARNVIYKH